MGMTIDKAIAKIWHCIVSIRDCTGNKEFVEALELSIETMRKYQMFQDQSLSLYMERSKVDMVAMLTDIQLEIKELRDSRYDVWLDNQYYIGKSDTLGEVDEIIQQKINLLRSKN